MDKRKPKDFFEDEAEPWVLTGYNDDGYNYPVALHRARIIQKIIGNLGENKLGVDLGCGGGNVSIALANNGHTMVGIDESKKMIEIANASLGKSSQSTQERVEFFCKPLEDNCLGEGQFDFCIAMGVIGYLAKDETLFDVARRLLKPGGVFFISCRNRLFNMHSISFRTEYEIANKKARDLIGEIYEMHKEIPTEAITDMLNRLKCIALELPDHGNVDPDQMKSPTEKTTSYSAYSPFSEPRQHTPKRLTQVAYKCGFDNSGYFGVHPHLINPRLNELLPPGVFNRISSCLEAFEHLPISLTWSSVFLGVFNKIDHAIK
jgi:SAM-dependent methyltransferase